MQDVGVAEWQKVMNTRATSHTVRAADSGWKGAQAGDLLLDIALPGGDHHLMYYLRRSDKGQWQVISEQTDF